MPSDALGSVGKRRSLRFAPSYRLRKRFEFRRLRDEGRRVHTRSFVLLIARGVEARGSAREQDNVEPGPRLGITVSRQVGNAVRRNRVKRLIREAFRHQRALLPETSDLVVIAKTGCRANSLREVQDELARAQGALRAAWLSSRAPTAGSVNER